MLKPLRKSDLLPGLKNKLRQAVQSCLRNRTTHTVEPYTSSVRCAPACNSVPTRSRIRTAFVLAGLLVCSPTLAYKPIAPRDKITQFSIPSRSAEESLIEFAKQADLTIIFPFETVEGKVANPLTGRFSIEQGIQILLKNTGLEAHFNKQGALTVRARKTTNQDKQDGSILAKITQLFTDDGDKIITFPKQENDDYELILVKGIRGSMQRSVDVKHSSSGVVDAIKAEDIGKFPDSNLAESLQRITGVSIDRSEGEGQFVTVRGFGPQFNTVLTNGRRMATDNLGREFSFDTLASEMVSGVSVYKTFSASKQSGGIGSTINIETARPLNQRGFKVAGSVSAMYDTNSEQSTPQGTFLVSHSNNEFGWLLSATHQHREGRIHEVQTDGWLLNTDIPADQLTRQSENVFVPRNYDQRVRFDTRKRTGATLVLQYRPNEDVEVSFDYLASQFDVKTDSTSMGHWFTSSNLEQVLTDENGTVVKFEQNVGHATDFHARTFDRPSKVEAIGLNAQWHVSPALSFETDLSLSKASIEDQKGAANALSLIGYLNRSAFDHTAGNTLPTISGFTEASADVVDALGNPSGVDNYLSPANGKAHVMLRRGWDIENQFDQFSFDGLWDDGLENLSAVKFGLMFTRQSKKNARWDNEKNAVHCTFCGYFNEPDIPDIFQSRFDAGEDFLSGISGHQELPKSWLRHDGEALFAFLESVSGQSFDAVQRDNSFTIEEKVQGAYLQADFSTEVKEMLATVEIGMRFEATDVTVSGIDSDLIALRILDQTELGPITSTPRPVEESFHYQNWLPSFTFKLDVSDEIVARMALSKSLTRPTMAQMSPALVLNTTRQGGDLRASTGSPDLKPFEATNLDLAVEWYYGASSYFSAGYFRKSVDNFIVSNVSELAFETVTDPSTGNDPSAPDSADEIARFDLTQPINGETATVDGWELAFQHTFESGFGILANMTLVDSNAQLDRNNVLQKFALTGLSDSQNLVLFYEKGPGQIRLAWNHREGFLQSLIQRQGAEPTFVDGYHQLDMSASYDINDNISLFVEGINITEEHVIKHGRYDNQLLLAQAPGARYTLGIRGSF